MTMNTQPPSDDELFRDWNETHSIKAFERLYRRVHPRLVRCLQSKGWASPDAEDGAHDAWLKTWLRKEPINFAWLVIVGRNFLISAKRKRREQRDDGLDPIASGDSRPEPIVMQKESDTGVRDCKHQHAADRDVAACVDRHEYGLSIPEIAHKNGCTTDAASCMVLRGKKKLRTCLEGKGHHAAEH